MPKPRDVHQLCHHHQRHTSITLSQVWTQGAILTQGVPHTDMNMKKPLVGQIDEKYHDDGEKEVGRPAGHPSNLDAGSPHCGYHLVFVVVNKATRYRVMVWVRSAHNTVDTVSAARINASMASKCRKSKALSLSFSLSLRWHRSVARAEPEPTQERFGQGERGDANSHSAP